MEKSIAMKIIFRPFANRLLRYFGSPNDCSNQQGAANSDSPKSMFSRFIADHLVPSSFHGLRRIGVRRASGLPRLLTTSGNLSHRIATLLHKEKGHSCPFLVWTGVSTLLIALTGICLAQEPEERVVLVPLGKAAKEAPLFFSATADVKAQVGLSFVTTDQQIDFKIHQGKPETLTLSLNGAGEVVSVTGQGLRDWAMRVTEDGSHFLDVRPVIDVANPLSNLSRPGKNPLQDGKGINPPAPSRTRRGDWILL